MTRETVRRRSAAAAKGARPYARQLRDDKKLRRHALNALDSGDRAARRLRGGGAVEAVRRAADDETARRELRRAATEIAQARTRFGKAKSHRGRNALLLLGGVGAALVAPKARGWLRRSPEAGEAASATTINEFIVVGVPVQTAYNQWTQFEEFPSFMQGVERVEQLDETRLHWVARVAGKRHEWDAKITEQEPDHRIAWAAVGGKGNSGTVFFRDLGDNSCEISLFLAYTPSGVVEKIGAALGLERRRVRGDLERFKTLIESRGGESGAWRGRIEGGETIEPA